MTPEIQKYIDQQIEKLKADLVSNFNVPYHIHNNIDAPYVPANAQILSSVPTGGNEGDILLYESGGTRRIYAKINGTWRYSTLT